MGEVAQIGPLLGQHLWYREWMATQVLVPEGRYLFRCESSRAATLGSPLAIGLLVPHSVTLPGVERPGALALWNLAWRNGTELLSCPWLGLIHPKLGFWFIVLKYVWVLKLESFFGKRQSAEFSISILCILFKTALNIRDTFSIWKLLWVIGRDIFFLSLTVCPKGSYVHFWKQKYGFVEFAFGWFFLSFPSPWRRKLVKIAGTLK